MTIQFPSLDQYHNNLGPAQQSQRPPAILNAPIKSYERELQKIKDLFTRQNYEDVVAECESLFEIPLLPYEVRSQLDSLRSAAEHQQELQHLIQLYHNKNFLRYACDV